MDTITHGLLGGVVVRAAFGKKANVPMVLAGTIGAMAPDIDVFIRSKADPLLFWTLHRHFTHSLLFVPIGALVIAVLFWLFWRKNTSFKYFYFAACLGYITHPLLDAATSFGTLLYWPFSDYRVSWDIIAVIDPVVTLVLLVGLIFAFRSTGKKGAIWALSLFLIYLCFGIYQHDRGEKFQNQLAQSRGHQVVHGRVMPTLGNLMVWRSIYENQESLYIDALRIIPGKGPGLFPGGKIQKFQLEQMPNALRGSMLYDDIGRFFWFSEGYTGVLKSQEGHWQVGDMRYSAISQGEVPIWGIEFSESEPDQHVKIIRFPRQYKSSLQALGNLLFNGK